MKNFAFDGNKKKFVPIAKAQIPVTDLVIQRGFGIKEDFRTYGKKPFGLKEHLARLRLSAKLVNFKGLPSEKYVRGIILKGLKKIDTDVWVKILVTGGESHHLVQESKPRLYVLFLKAITYPQSMYEKGIKLRTVDYQRPYPGAKSPNYFAGVVEQMKAESRGFDGVLYIRDGIVTEGPTYNVVARYKDTLVAPKEGVLEGITIQVVMKLTREMGLKPKRRKLTLSQLLKADEVITTSTYSEIVPVVKIDKKQIGNGKPGVITKQLIKDYGDFVRKNSKI